MAKKHLKYKPIKAADSSTRAVSLSKTVIFTQARIRFLICVFLLFATLAIYLQTTSFSFAGLDDGVYIYKNFHVQRGLTLQNIAWAFSFHCCNWHPLTWLSHMLDCQLYGLNPAGHHLTNVLLHIANSILLFLLLVRLTGYTWRSAFAAALFALHPLHVESVAWAAERKDVLSTLFMFLTILAYSRYTAKRSIGRYITVVITYALGLMAKPMLVSLPIVLLLLDYWPIRSKNCLSKLIIEKIPLFTMAGASCIVTLLAQNAGGAVRSFDTFPMSIRIANMFVAYMTYIWKMLWPSNLSFLYPHPGKYIPLWLTAFCAVSLAIITILAIRNARKLPYIIVGWLWYVVIALPVIGLIQVGGQAIADRYTYVPIIGLFIIISWLIPDLLSRLSLSASLRSVLLAVPAGVVIVLLIMTSRIQTGYWRSSETLYTHAFQATHGDYTIRCWMADLLIAKGKPDEAISLLESARENKPGLAQVQNALGCIYAREKKPDRAFDEYNEAILIRPEFPEAHNNLGTLLASQGKLDKALVEFKEAARLEPRYAEANYNIAVILARNGNNDEAIRYFERSLAADPDRIDAHCRLGMLLLQQDDIKNAIHHFSEAIELDPKQAEPHYLLATALQQEGRIKSAIEELNKTIKLRPDWGAAHNMLAAALYENGDYSGAWTEIHLARKCGTEPEPEFVKELSSRMTEPMD